VSRGAGYEVDAHAQGGRVESYIDGLAPEPNEGRQRLRGTIGSGGAMLKLRTSHGSIRISEGGA
jgi:hypothetical protein